MSATYCLDDYIDRHNTNCVKWDGIPGADNSRESDILPLWVADMDFRVPPEIIHRMHETVEHGIFGYTALPARVWRSVASWTERRYGWPVREEWMSYTAGVITGLNIAIQTFTRPGEKIVIQPPVYPPFHTSVRTNGRRLLYNHLVEDSSGVFRIDLEGLRALVDDETRMLVLCNPHNPVGRAWTREELEGVAEIALERDILVFSDEIHADLILSERQHVPFASLGPDVAARTITGIAPSKTFNIAGLKASVIITSNERIKRDFDAAQARTFGLYDANTFAIVGMQAAYEEGEPWLETVLSYLRESRDVAMEFIRRELQAVRVAPPEATFLFWLDFSRTGYSHEELSRVLREEARVVLNSGRSFGPGGEHHFRLNFGCPRSVLMEGLERIADAFAHAPATGRGKV
ncbi:MAG: MalY/PatB family protein [Alkalispirochaetaceae bacterium]